MLYYCALPPLSLLPYSFVPYKIYVALGTTGEHDTRVHQDQKTKQPSPLKHRLPAPEADV